jgi:predicted alpha/beta-hydrolase family hydrolase
MSSCRDHAITGPLTAVVCFGSPSFEAGSCDTMRKSELGGVRLRAPTILTSDRTRHKVRSKILFATMNLLPW